MADIEIRTDEEFENAQRELSALVEQGPAGTMNARWISRTP